MLCYCKKCGRVVQCDKVDEKCDYCSSSLHSVPLEYTVRQTGIVINKDLKEKLVEELVKSSPEFDQYLFEHRDKDLFEQSMKRMAQFERAKSMSEEKSRVPKCPSCGSSNISKIGMINRAVSTHFLGLASSKIGKTHKCNHCGTTW